MKNLKLIALLFTGMLISLSALTAEDGTTIIGDVEMPEVQHSEAFNQVKKMLGKWEGRQTQYTGNVIDASYEFRLVSGGNTITENLVEDGVEMLTTYSDKDGELVVKHYCALGTQPVFKVANVSNKVLSLEYDDSASDYHPEHHSFVKSMKWTINSDNPSSATLESNIYLDGELTVAKTIMKKVY